MMSAQPETIGHLTVCASDQLHNNAEHIAWQAHQLAAEIADNDSNAVIQGGK